MDFLTEIRRPIEEELKQYKLLFDSTLTHDDQFLGSVLNYLRGRNGKMMRPILVLLVAKELGAVNDCALRAAVTLELLHTASLVHDDVVDESNKRRGQASINAVYDNKVAVLLGDYLLSASLHQSALSGDIRVVDIIARLGGTLSEGEIFQIENIRNEEISEAAYFRIINHKTAALFAACSQLGAIAGGGSAEFIARAKKLGELVGICFQIRDDIFDYYDSKEIGKPTATDMAEGKLTLPAIYAVKNAADPAIHQLAARIKAGEASAHDIEQMVNLAKESGGIDYAIEVMHRYHAEAIELLEGFQDDAVRTSLKLYMDYVIGRNI